MSHLKPGEKMYVEFNTRWYTDTTLKHDVQANGALVKFDVDSTEFHIKDWQHNFSLHLLPQP